MKAMPRTVMTIMIVLTGKVTIVEVIMRMVRVVVSGNYGYGSGGSGDNDMMAAVMAVMLI